MRSSSICTVLCVGIAIASAAWLVGCGGGGDAAESSSGDVTTFGSSAFDSENSPGMYVEGATYVSGAMPEASLASSGRPTVVSVDIPNTVTPGEWFTITVRVQGGAGTAQIAASAGSDDKLYVGCSGDPGYYVIDADESDTDFIWYDRPANIWELSIEAFTRMAARDSELAAAAVSRGQVSEQAQEQMPVAGRSTENMARYAGDWTLTYELLGVRKTMDITLNSSGAALGGSVKWGVYGSVFVMDDGNIMMSCLAGSTNYLQGGTWRRADGVRGTFTMSRKMFETGDLSGEWLMDASAEPVINANTEHWYTGDGLELRSDGLYSCDWSNESHDGTWLVIGKTATLTHSDSKSDVTYSGTVRTPDLITGTVTMEFKHSNGSVYRTDEGTFTMTRNGACVLDGTWNFRRWDSYDFLVTDVSMSFIAGGTHTYSAGSWEIDGLSSFRMVTEDGTFSGAIDYDGGISGSVIGYPGGFEGTFSMCLKSHPDEGRLDWGGCAE